MLIIGERINTSRKPVNEAVEKRDAAFIQAVSTNIQAGLMALEAIERIHRHFDGVKTVCGLSNISFGLPKRFLVNRTFLPLVMRAGLSAAIIDPLDKRLMGTLRATAGKERGPFN